MQFSENLSHSMLTFLTHMSKKRTKHRKSSTFDALPLDSLRVNFVIDLIDCLLFIA